MKHTSLFLRHRFLGGVLAATMGILTAGSLRAVDTPLYWYGAGEEGERGGDGTWSQNNANPSRWYDEENETFYSWTDARTNFGYNGENLIVAIFSGTAGTVTVGNLGPNAQTFIGTVSVLTGGYTFTANNNSVTLAGSDRVNLLVNTADKTPVVFEEGLTVGLRNNLRTFEIAEGDELTIKGVIDNGRFNKTGAGTLRLTGGGKHVRPQHGHHRGGGNPVYQQHVGFRRWKRWSPGGEWRHVGRHGYHRTHEWT